MKKLYLVDVSSMFFRAFYAVRPLSTSKGVPTNAVYGFLSMIVKLLKDIKPDHMAFCFDRPEPSFRKEIYGEYKANRSEMPEDLAPQIPYIKKVTEILGIPIFEKPGFEADDLIGTLTCYGLKQKLEVVIVSGDKDFSQLIEPGVTMYDTMKDIRFDAAKVLEKFGVPPERFIDYLAITGDSSDNIPGVKGVGPKGAQKLIEDFGTVEAIYERIDEVKNPGMKKKLIEAKEMALLSKKLVTIDQHMDIPITMDMLTFKKIQHEELTRLLEELEFQSFKKNLVGDTLGNAAEAPANTVAVAPAATALNPLSSVPNLAPVAQQASPFTVHRLQEDEFQAWLGKRSEVWSVDREREYVFAGDNDIVVYQGSDARLKEILEARSSLAWLGYDLKSIWRQMKLEKRQTAKWDSMLAAYVAKAGPVESFQEIHTRYTQNQLPELNEPVSLYQAHLDLHRALTAELNKTSMLNILETIELPVVDLLTAMETKGVLIDVDFLKDESKALSEDLKGVEKTIYDLSGEPFNIGSPKQLGQILFEKLKLPPGKKTKTGYSTNSDVLEKLEEQFPIAREIINYREISKLKSTYVDALPALVSPENGRVHTQFNQALTATGRLSSVQPNLQNIPIRSERGLRIRRAFVAAPGYILVSSDYSQIELRILAHISKDPGLVDAFENDIDIHAKAASEIFGVPINDVSDDLRRKAKAVNFGIAYGQGAFGLADNLKISRGEAKEIIDLYFQRFAGVKKYMQDIVTYVQENGYVETILGRRRYLPEIRSKNQNVKAFAERAAINAPIQGMSSDLVKLAMIEVGQEFRDSMILQVHDELIFELRDDGQLSKNMEKIRQLMENCMKLDVPLKVNVSKAKSWAEL